MEYAFRQIRDAECDAAYSLQFEAVSWLRREKRLFTTLIDDDLFFEWQQHGYNYGLFELPQASPRATGDLVAGLSLVPWAVGVWPENELPKSKKLWLHCLATALAHKGKGLGRRAVEQAILHAKQHGADLYLCCVRGNGFLPDYYAKLGFTILDTREQDLGLPDKHEIVLMYSGV